MEEDSEDKVRRNLVVFCSLVLGTLWLNVPLGELVDSALGLRNGGEVSEFRIWIALLATHAYLSIRYRYTAKARAGFFAYLADVSERVKRVRRSIFLFANRNMKHSIKKGGEDSHWVDSIIFGWIDVPEADTRQHTINQDPRIILPTRKMEVDMPSLRLRWMLLGMLTIPLVYVSSLLYSRSIGDFSVPVALSITTFCAIIVRLYITAGAI